MIAILKTVRAAIGLYVALRPSGRELILLAWGGGHERMRQDGLVASKK